MANDVSFIPNITEYNIDSECNFKTGLFKDDEFKEKFMQIFDQQCLH